MGVYSTERVVEEEDVVVAVHGPRQADPLLLTATEVDALKWTLLYSSGECVDWIS